METGDAREGVCHVELRRCVARSAAGEQGYKVFHTRNNVWKGQARTLFELFVRLAC